jgi:GT2 family glycosyltransferase
MKLSIIVVSFNTKQITLDCLKSIYATADDLKLEVIVVDNASTDGSAELATIKNPDNKGFAAANNQGIRIAKGEYILLLNSDTIVKPHAFKRLINFMDSHPQVGIAAPQLLNPDGSIQPNGGFLPRLSNIIAWMLFVDDLPFVSPWFWSYQLRYLPAFRRTRAMGWLQGAALVLRRYTIEEVGPLDENIFMYAEDVDICYRARKSGWQVMLLPQAQIIHKGFQSGSSEKSILGEYQGLKYIFQKHKPAWEMPLLRCFLKLGALLRLIIFGTILRDKHKYAIYKTALALA